MKKLLFISIFFLPLAMFAQDDDPFGGGDTGGDDPFGGGNTGGDDPFGNPDPPTTDSDTVPIDDSTPNNSDNDNPFGSGDTDDTFQGGGNDSGFDGTGSGGFGNSIGQETSSRVDIFDRMVDTLKPPLVPEFPWEQKSIEERPILSTFDVREADVFWSKTVWREIDLREKMNHPFAYPKAPFMTVLLDVLQKNPDIPVYTTGLNGSDFDSASDWNTVREQEVKTDEITIFDEDENGNEIQRDSTIINQFRSSNVKRFRIKEVWYFDKKHSRMKVQIMGIAPLKTVTATDLGADAIFVQQLGGDDGGNLEPLFWVYYPDVREHLARYETMNPLNDAIRMSWDDLFTSRFFSSYITKVSNPLDESIKDYRTNKLDALYESEKVKEDIFNFEHDLWSY